MVTSEIVDNKRAAQQYTDFITGLRRQIPPQEDPDSAPFCGGKSTASALVQGWDSYGGSFLHLESLQFYEATMFALLENIKEVKGRERWLSLGSGTGTYELFLARMFPTVTIDSVDIAPKMVDFQKRLLADHPDATGRIRPIVGDIANLGSLERRGFNRVFCINALQWSPRWKKAVSELTRALSPTPKAKAYIVLAAAYIEYPMSEISQLNPDLNESSLTREVERNGLEPVVLGEIWVAQGQRSQNSRRFYLVAEKGDQKSRAWTRRVTQGELPIVNYYFDGLSMRSSLTEII